MTLARIVNLKTQKQLFADMSLSELFHSYVYDDVQCLWTLLLRMGLEIGGLFESKEVPLHDSQFLNQQIQLLDKKELLTSRESILLGVAYKFGCFINKNLDKAASLFHFAAEHKEPEAYTLLAVLNDDFLDHMNVSQRGISKLADSILEDPHDEVTSVDADALIAYHNLLQAVKLGDSRACSILSIMFLYGVGVKQDIFKAKSYAIEGSKRNDDMSVNVLNSIKHIASGKAILSSVMEKKPEVLAKIFQRCINLDSEIRSKVANEIKMISTKINSRVSKLNPFHKKENFITNFHLAIAVEDKNKLKKLEKKNSKLFHELCDGESFENLEPLLDKETSKKIISRNNIKIASKFVPTYTQIYQHLQEPNLTQLVLIYMENNMDLERLHLIENNAKIERQKYYPHSAKKNMPFFNKVEVKEEKKNTDSRDDRKNMRLP